MARALFVVVIPLAVSCTARDAPTKAEEMPSAEAKAEPETPPAEPAEPPAVPPAPADPKPEVDAPEAKPDAPEKPAEPARPPLEPGKYGPPKLGVHRLALGYGHGCVLLEEGIRCWGVNGSGQLGDGTTKDRPVAVTVKGIDDAVSIAAEDHATCALRGDGSLWCWGDNNEGVLGRDLPVTAHPEPTRVPGAEKNIVAVSMGDRLTCVADGDGKVRCWGAMTDVKEYALEEKVAGLPPAIDVGVASSHVCGLSAEGTVACRGPNFGGLLGAKGAGPRAVPGIASARAFSMGAFVGCALGEKGKLACWGDSSNAGASRGFVAVERSAANLASLPEIVQVSTGFQHTCAVAVDGRVSCWGRNQLGQSLPQTVDLGSALPRFVEGLEDAVEVVAGGDFSCALRRGGEVVCWGEDAHGQLGGGKSEVATAAVGLEKLALTDVVHLDGFSGMLFVAKADHTVLSVEDTEDPEVVSEGKPVVEVEAGCVLFEDGTTDCEGSHNDRKITGLGEETHQPPCVLYEGGALACSPFNRFLDEMPPIPDGVVTVTSERSEICVVTGKGRVACFGELPFGGGEDAEEVKLTWVDGVKKAVDVSATWDEGCALEKSGTVKCWPNYPPHAYEVHPMKGMPKIASITSMARHTCAVARNGEVWCWGRGYWGELGDGARSDRTVPVKVLGVPAMKDVAGGDTYSCGLTTEGGEVWCWGALFDELEEDTKLEASGLVTVAGLPAATP